MKIGLELACVEGDVVRLCARVDVTERDEAMLESQGVIPESIIGNCLDTVRPVCPYLQCAIGATFSRHVQSDALIARVSCVRDENLCRPGFGYVTTIQACGRLATVFSEYGLTDESEPI